MKTQHRCIHHIPFAVPGRGGGSLMKSRPCHQPVNASGWCTDHAYCAEVFTLAETLGFPDFAVAFKADGVTPSYLVCAGRGSWEVYMEYHSLRNHRDVLRRLQEAVRAMEAVNARRLIRRAEAVKAKLPELVGVLPPQEITALRAEANAVIIRLRASLRATGGEWVDMPPNAP